MSESLAETNAQEADSSIATNEPSTSTKRKHSQDVEEEGTKRRRLSVEEEQIEPRVEATADSTQSDSNDVQMVAVDGNNREQDTAVASSDHAQGQETAQADTITKPRNEEPTPSTEQQPKHVASEIRKPQDNEVSAPPRKRPGVAVDEKQRSRRLFGSILGTIGQRTDRTVKKRQEIEARTQAESKQHDAALNDDRGLRQKRTAERLKQEQWRVDEEDMKIQHRNMRHSANFLQTRARPVIYYRPWDLRPDEERRIAQQKEDVERRIDAEISSFNRRRANASNARRPSIDSQESSTVAGDQAVDGDGKDTPLQDAVKKDSGDPLDAANVSDAPPADVGMAEAARDEVHEKQILPTDAEVPAESTAPPVKAGELDDEQMVEGDEDNVIY